MGIFRCTVCGYKFEGPEAPEFCPKCGAPKDKFIALDEESAKKVVSSARTNSIHAELIAIADRVIALAEEGIEINLDPPCVALFHKAVTEATQIRQRSKAEIEGHIGKGKW